MTYKSLYRKYRPNRFEDVCGQKFIVQTLTNALLNEKISHAYLFCGTRGTGKTTIAKIFAKNVNCLEPNNNLPCGKCEICKNENTDEIQDIIEIDAASNNGVDEIRELKNKIKLVPVMCKYKVYIIDEVHMLSTGAFNALLKTLEEPPSHVIFILATTEPQKLPITIISRCQRFDFKKLSLVDITERLKYIAEKENIIIEYECINEIAKLSGGAMRDAIGLLDQISSFSNKKVTLEDLYQINGNIPYNMLFELINAYLSNDINTILEIIEKIYIDGKDFIKLTESILILFRNIYIFFKAPKYYNEKNDVKDNIVIKLSKKVSIANIENIIENFEKLSREIKFSDYPKLLFELYMLKSIKLYEEKSDKVEKNFIESKINYKSKSEKTANEAKNGTIENIEGKYIKNSNLNASTNEYKKALINNTIALATAKDKKNAQKIFEYLDKYIINKKSKIAATILKDANISAASSDHILLTYKYDSMVEENDNNIEDILKLIKNILNKKYIAVAITDEEWVETRPKYIKIKKSNGEIPLLEEKNTKNETNNLLNRTEEYNDIIDTFGSELIEMEE